MNFHGKTQALEAAYKSSLSGIIDFAFSTCDLCSPLHLVYCTEGYDLVFSRRSEKQDRDLWTDLPSVNSDEVKAMCLDLAYLHLTSKSSENWYVENPSPSGNGKPCKKWFVLYLNSDDANFDEVFRLRPCWGM